MKHNRYANLGVDKNEVKRELHDLRSIKPAVDEIISLLEELDVSVLRRLNLDIHISKAHFIMSATSAIVNSDVKAAAEFIKDAAEAQVERATD